jgi:peptide/nickel transport system substrate-binding protein
MATGSGSRRSSDLAELLKGELSRRRILQAALVSGGLMSVPGLLEACGGGTSSGSSAAASPGGSPRQGGSLTWGLVSDPVTLAPFGIGNTSSAEVKNLVYESLVRWDRNLQVQPALAESWETPDSRTYVFHLRKGVKFHSGREMTAEDVQYSLASQKSPPAPGNVNSFFPKVASVDVVDQYTVRLNMSQPDATVLGYLAWNVYSYICPKGLYESSDPRNKADGTGPFRVDEFVPNDHVTLSRNAAYWRSGFPHVDRVTMKVLADEQARVAALRSGAIDGATLTPDTVRSLQNDPNLTVLKGATAAFKEIEVAVKGTGKPWDNVKVRQAMAMAIDRQDIIDKVYGGDAQFSSKIPPSYGKWPIPGSDLKSKYEKLDLEGARKLLADAGFASGFPLTLQAIAHPDEYVKIAQVLQAQWKKLNINVTVQPLEIGTFAQLNSTGQFEMQCTGRGMRGDPSGYFSDFDPAGSTYKAWYAGGYKNQELFDLITQGLATTDTARRMQQYTRMQQIVLSEWPTIPLVVPTKYHVVRKRVQNMYVSVDDTERGLIESWLSQ